MTDDIPGVGLARFSRPIGLLHARIVDRSRPSGVLAPFAGVLSRRRGSDPSTPLAFSYLGPRLFVLGPVLERERPEVRVERPERASPGRHVVERVTVLPLLSSDPSPGHPATPSRARDPGADRAPPTTAGPPTATRAGPTVDPSERPSVPDRSFAAPARTVLGPPFPFVPVVERFGVERSTEIAAERSARSGSSTPFAHIDRSVRTTRTQTAPTGPGWRTGEQSAASAVPLGRFVLARPSTVDSESPSAGESRAADATAGGGSRRALPDRSTGQTGGDGNRDDRLTPPTRFETPRGTRTRQPSDERHAGWNRAPLVARRPPMRGRAGVSEADTSRDRRRSAAIATPVERSAIESPWTVLRGGSGETDADGAEPDETSGGPRAPADGSSVGSPPENQAPTRGALSAGARASPARLDVRSLAAFGLGHRRGVARTRGDAPAGSARTGDLWAVDDDPPMTVRRPPSAEAQQAASGTGEPGPERRRQPLPGATEGRATRARTGERTATPETVRGMDVDRFADRLYRRLERKARVERERRGL